MTNILFIIFLVGCMNIERVTVTHAHAINTEATPVDFDSSSHIQVETEDMAVSEQTCLSQASLDTAKGEIESLTMAKKELVKVVNEVLLTKADELATAEKEWREETDLAIQKAVAEKEALLLETRALLAQAVAEVEAADSVALQNNEMRVEAQLEVSGCMQQVTDLESAISASQLQVERLGPVLEELRRDRDQAAEALQTMKATCKAQLDDFICDSSRCQEVLRQSSGSGGGGGGERGAGETLRVLLGDLRDHLSAGGVALGAYWTVYTRHAGALYTLLYTRHLQSHVEELMRSEPVLQFLEHVDYLEGKAHVFLYFAWKDTPRVVVKVVREAQYLAYFVHWKSKLAVSSLAVLARSGLSAAGVRGGSVSLDVLEGVIYLLGAAVTLLVLLVFKKPLWAVASGFLRAVCFCLLCPYWMVTKPFRILYGAIMK